MKKSFLLIYCLFLLCCITLADNKKSLPGKIKITSVEKSPPLRWLDKQAIKLGDEVTLVLDGDRSSKLDSFKIEDLRIKINGFVVDSCRLIKNNGNLQFTLRKTESLKKFRANNIASFHFNISPKFCIEAKIGDHFVQISENKTQTICFLTNSEKLATLLWIVFIVGFFYMLSQKTNLIRIGKENDSPFSLTLTQFVFWTVIIISSYFFLWLVNGTTVDLPASTQQILGVSILTAAGSKLVDIRQNMLSGLKSEGFFNDILSEDNVGYSVHRCQLLLWTLLFGIVFVSQVITKQEMPDLGSGTINTMGISSAAFVALKFFEKKAISVNSPTPPITPQPANPQNP